MPTLRRSTPRKRKTDLARQSARPFVEGQERMVLRGADREVFLGAIAHPGRPAPRLIAALRKHRILAVTPVKAAARRP